MGRLYDKRDLEFNLAFWDKQEQRLHADIANGVLSASTLDDIVRYGHIHSEKCKADCPGRTRYVKMRDAFDYERKRERFQLLRTAQLLGDLRRCEQQFKDCTRCHVVKKGTKESVWECPAHRPQFKLAKNAVYWAGEHNIAVRAARGQIRTEGVATAREALEGVEPPAEGNPLNEWEAWYLRDKRDGTWSDRDREYHVQEYGSHDYLGWLHMLREEEEISEAEFLSECRRFKSERDGAAENIRAVAGTNFKITRRNAI